ncbi:MAG: hypothetical protein ACPGRZ_01850 [Alphaproteobacteria bacterium]
MDGLQRDTEQDLEFLRDNDSFYILPLKYVPLETPALRRGRLVKTFPLATAVEVIRYNGGMGFFLIEDLLSGGTDEIFGWTDGHMHPDAELVRVLATLNSYDVYNLRIKFKQHNIDYEGYEYLQLSQDMQDELSVYMREFTRPLIETVFGADALKNNPDRDIISLLRDPDNGDALENLQRLSKKLNVHTEEIPRFLDEFSDVYLAVSYYKHYADRGGVVNASLMEDLRLLPENLKWKHDPEVERGCAEIREFMRALFMQIYAKLDEFERETKLFWVDLNPQRFRQLQKLIRESQSMVAGVLCGVGVKLSRWREQFPTA